MAEQQHEPSTHVQPFLERTAERVIEGVDVYVAGTEDEVVTGRTLSIHEALPERWVGRIDTNLRAFADVRLEVRFSGVVSPRVSQVVVGPRVRDQTLISGVGPVPG